MGGGDDKAKSDGAEDDKVAKKVRDSLAVLPDFWPVAACALIEAEVEGICALAKVGSFKERTVDRTPLRSKYFFGYGYTYGSQISKKGGEQLLPPGMVDPIPAWIHEKLIAPLEEAGKVPVGWINSAVVNDYRPGGMIVSHIDPPQLFARPILISSFFAEGRLVFGSRFSFPVPGGAPETSDPKCVCAMPRGSLTVMDGFSANGITHGLRPEDMDGRRVSIVLRHVFVDAPTVGVGEPAAALAAKRRHRPVERPLVLRDRSRDRDRDRAGSTRNGRDRSRSGARNIDRGRCQNRSHSRAPGGCNDSSRGRRHDRSQSRIRSGCPTQGRKRSSSLKRSSGHSRSQRRSHGRAQSRKRSRSHGLNQSRNRSRNRSRSRTCCARRSLSGRRSRSRSRARNHAGRRSRGWSRNRSRGGRHSRSKSRNRSRGGRRSRSRSRNCSGGGRRNHSRIRICSRGGRRSPSQRRNGSRGGRRSHSCRPNCSRGHAKDRKRSSRRCRSRDRGDGQGSLRRDNKAANRRRCGLRVRSSSVARDSVGVGGRRGVGKGTKPENDAIRRAAAALALARRSKSRSRTTPLSPKGQPRGRRTSSPSKTTAASPDVESSSEDTESSSSTLMPRPPDKVVGYGYGHGRERVSSSSSSTDSESAAANLKQ